MIEKGRIAKEKNIRFCYIRAKGNTRATFRNTALIKSNNSLWYISCDSDFVVLSKSIEKKTGTFIKSYLMIVFSF